MPLQNRVGPDGAIVATPARGTMFGIRGGCFHRPDRTLKRRHWAGRRWICCLLAFKGRRRKLMQPDLYTELFFLDEATAMAAGHRPCFECRRVEAQQFRSLWAEVHGSATPPSADAMDRVLHAERLTGTGGKRTVPRAIGQIPAGAIVAHDSGPALVTADALHPWSFAGYGAAIPRPRLGTFPMFTPPSIAAILLSGYRPMLHASCATL